MTSYPVIVSLFLGDIFTFFFSARDTNEIKQLDTYSEYSPDEL